MIYANISLIIQATKRKGDLMKPEKEQKFMTTKEIILFIKDRRKTINDEIKRKLRPQHEAWVRLNELEFILKKIRRS